MARASVRMERRFDCAGWLGRLEKTNRISDLPPAMATPSPQSIEILLRVAGGPAIEADGAGSYRCEGRVKLDSEQFGPSALRVHLSAPILESIAKGAGSEDLISADAMERMFLDSLYERMRAAGAEPNEDAAGTDSPSLDGRPLAFSCDNVLAAENAALDFLSLAFGDQARIDLWQIDVMGDAALVRCGPLVSDANPKENELGALVRFGFVSAIRDEDTGEIVGFEQSGGSAWNLTQIAVALSRSDLAEMDRALPPFVGPLPGARLDAISALIGERIREQLASHLTDANIAVSSWRGELGAFSLAPTGKGTPIFEIDIVANRPRMLDDDLKNAAIKALGGKGVPHLEKTKNKELVCLRAVGGFMKERTSNVRSAQSSEPSTDRPDNTPKKRPGPPA